MEKYWKLKETTPMISPTSPPKAHACKCQDEFEEHLEKLTTSNKCGNDSV